MHQCAISAKDINQHIMWNLEFGMWSWSASPIIQLWIIQYSLLISIAYNASGRGLYYRLISFSLFFLLLRKLIWRCKALNHKRILRKWEWMQVAHSEPVSSLMFGFQKASFPKPSSSLTSSFRGHQHSLSWKIKRWCAIAQSCKWYQSVAPWNIYYVGLKQCASLNV